nr:hypothetical protein [Serratia marcescens]
MRASPSSIRGKCEVADFGPGDVWYFPSYGHSIQALADGAHFTGV